MRLFVIAPLKPHSAHTSYDPVFGIARGDTKSLAEQIRAATGSVFSRSDLSNPVVNAQLWQPIELRRTDDELGVSINHLWVVKRMSQRALIAEAEILNPQATPVGVNFESGLNRLFTSIVSEATELSRFEIAWVSRTRVTEVKETELHSSLSESGSDSPAHKVFHLPELSGDLSVGWGNNELRLAFRGRRKTDAFLEEASVRSLVEGLIDAQFSWFELDQISFRTSMLRLETLSEGGAHISRTKLNRVTREIAQVQDGLALHRLSLDELRFRTQGLRQSVSLFSLRCWGYEESERRVKERVDDLSVTINNWRSNLENRFQGAVELILLIFTLITSIGLALSFISTAFVGGESGPADESGPGVLAWFRESDSDLVLGIFGGVILLTLVVLLPLRYIHRLRANKKQD